MPDFVVDHGSPLAVWSQLARDLRRQIDRGELAAGSRLPTERSLAETYGVNRLTVRQAFDELAKSGLISRRRGSGTFVAENVVTVQHDLSLDEHWRARVEASGHEVRSISISTRTVPLPPRAVLNELDLDPDALAPRAPWHEYLRTQTIDGITIGVSSSWVPASIAELLPKDLQHGSLSATIRERLNLRSSSTINVMESAGATSGEAKLLDTYLDAPVTVIFAVNQLADSAVLNLSRTVWLGTRVRFRSARMRTSSD